MHLQEAYLKISTDLVILFTPHYVHVLMTNIVHPTFGMKGTASFGLSSVTGPCQWKQSDYSTQFVALNFNALLELTFQG